MRARRDRPPERLADEDQERDDRAQEVAERERARGPAAPQHDGSRSQGRDGRHDTIAMAIAAKRCSAWQTAYSVPVRLATSAVGARRRRYSVALSCRRGAQARPGDRDDAVGADLEHERQRRGRPGRARRGRCRPGAGRPAGLGRAGVEVGGDHRRGRPGRQDVRQGRRAATMPISSASRSADTPDVRRQEQLADDREHLDAGRRPGQDGGRPSDRCEGDLAPPGSAVRRPGCRPAEARGHGPGRWRYQATVRAMPSRNGTAGAVAEVALRGGDVGQGVDDVALARRSEDRLGRRGPPRRRWTPGARAACGARRTRCCR